MQVELCYKTSTKETKKLLSGTGDWMLQLLFKHENNKQPDSIAKELYNFVREPRYNLEL